MYCVLERQPRKPWTICYYVKGSKSKAIASALECAAQMRLLGGRVAFAVCDESKIDGRHRAI